MDLTEAGTSLVAQRVKRLPTVRETWVRSLGQEDPLEKEMATHSSTLAWKIPSQASLSITSSWSLLKLMSIESVLPSSHLILCCPLLLPSILPSIRVFSNESVLHIRWPKYWSFSFSISLFIHSLIEGHLDCFQFLTIINNLVISISVQVFVRS